MSIEERRARIGMTADEARLIRRNVSCSGAAALAAALLLCGAFKAFDTWTEAKHVSRASRQVEQIVANFASIYGSRPLDLGKWPTDITAYAIDRNFLPPEMLPSNASCHDAGSRENCSGVGPWPGSVARIYSGQQYDAISIAYFNLDNSACSALASALINPDAPLPLVIANINESNYMFPPIGNNDFPNAADLAHDCDNGSGNKVGLMYSLK